MTLILAKARRAVREGATEGERSYGPEQRMLGIAYCQKHRALLSKRVEQFVDDLVAREPTSKCIRHLHAVMAASRRDPRSSVG